MALPLRLTDYVAELMRLHLRYRAIAAKFSEVRDPEFRRELANAKQELARAFAMLDRA
jgi:hypothetical protein